MARLLVATVPLTGHVHPMLIVVRELVTRGHAIDWYAASKFRPAIEAAGATFHPRRRAPDWDDADLEAAFPALRGTRGIKRVKRQLRELFIAPLADELADLEAIATATAPDAIVADQAHLGAMALAERAGLPWAGLGISALVIPSRDLPPFGPAWRPPTTAFGRARVPMLHRGVAWIFGDVERAYRAARAAVGLPAEGSYFAVLSSYLFLQPTIEELEYPRSDLPPQVHFIGPLVGVPPAAELPAWWPELLAARAARRPIVLVTQGTMAVDPAELIVPALRGLANGDAFVVATTAAELANVPPNARVARFIPYPSLLPLVDLMVTNGGYGGVQMALAAGVPLVVAGGSEEKPEIAARVAFAGAGVDLRTGRPSARKVRRAVLHVLQEPRYRERAQAIATKMSACDAPRTAAALVEELVARRQPIVRGSLPP